MNITESIAYIGVNDHSTDLFEGQYPVPDGMSYNSYLIKDEKTAVMDTVDAAFKDQWLSNLEKALEGRTPDYLVVQHMEPDHSANIMNFAAKYPKAQIIASPKAFAMMKNFFGTDFSENRLAVKEGDRLSLGSRTLSFVTAPMVHWPEVIVTYDDKDKVLFSADGFGKFGALDREGEWLDEARRYYIGIVGKFGMPVQTLLKKASALDISMICPLHGPVLRENLGYYIGMYDTWSKYKPESDGVLIAYTSVYGNTKKAALLLEEKLSAAGKEVQSRDLARSDMAQCVAEAFKYKDIVLASTTYNGDVYPFMREFILDLTERNFRSRRVGIIENGTWAPAVSRTVKAMLEKCSDISFCENEVKIDSALNKTSEEQLEALAKELL